jgi:GAF domain-containing protein
MAMRAPRIPDDERGRLEALWALRVLDTPAEERFDRLTRLARKMFDVPIALVSLVDEHRQWFKSRAGILATETPRATSFCGHTILDERIFVVPNALEDERFRDNPLVVRTPHVRFYAGCPLHAPNGHRVGALCLMDRRPRQFSDDDRMALKDLAAMVEHELAAVQLATLDALTGVPNRRGFALLAEQSLRFCRRQGLPMSIVFVDLDGFKGINDRFGHAEGDRALVRFGALLRTTAPMDVVGRPLRRRRRTAADEGAHRRPRRGARPRALRHPGGERAALLLAGAGDPARRHPAPTPSTTPRTRSCASRSRASSSRSSRCSSASAWRCS